MRAERLGNTGVFVGGLLTIAGMGMQPGNPLPPPPGDELPYAWVEPGCPHSRLPAPVAASFVREAVNTVLSAAIRTSATYLGPGAPLNDDPLADAVVQACAKQPVQLRIIEAEPLWWEHRPSTPPYSVVSLAELDSADLSSPTILTGLLGVGALREAGIRLLRRACSVRLRVIPWNSPAFEWEPASGAPLMADCLIPCAAIVAPVSYLDDHRSVRSLLDLIARLRAPDGCPWDREQTHASLRRFMIEEAYEAVDAIDAGGGKLADELGDVLVQVLLHAQIAFESGDFDFGDVVASIARKLIRRHPHVFGSVKVEGLAQVLENWETIKTEERGHADFLHGIPRALPALSFAREAIARASRIERAIHLRNAPPEPVEAVEKWLAGVPAPDREAALGQFLFALVAAAGGFGLDPEEALTRENRRFRDRVETLSSPLGRNGMEPDRHV